MNEKRFDDLIDQARDIDRVVRDWTADVDARLRALKAAVEKLSREVTHGSRKSAS